MLVFFSLQALACRDVEVLQFVMQFIVKCLDGRHPNANQNIAAVG